MIKKITFLFIALLIISVSLVSALPDDIPTQPIVLVTPTQSIITTTTTPLFEKQIEIFYGTAMYIDGNPIENNSVVTARDQYNNVVGNTTITEIGNYGSNKPYGSKFEVSITRDIFDKSTRSSIIFISFYVNNIRSKDSIEFRSSETTQFNILIPITKPISSPVEIITIPVTTESVSIPNDDTTTINSVPTITNTSIQSLVTPTIPKPQSLINNVSDNDLILYGLLTMGLIIIGILLTTAVFSYLTNRSSRDEVLGPEKK